MERAAHTDSAAAMAALRRFASRPPKVREEVCDFCAAGLAGEHQHLIDPANRRLVCACDACAILFDSPTAKFRRVPRRIVRLAQPVFTDAQWETLAIPIGMAFFFHSTPLERIVAMYPGPAGATESLLPLETWNEVAGADSPVRRVMPDVEALLVNRVSQRHGAISDRSGDYVVPIDRCYKLVGLIRAEWRGFSGGTEAWEAIDRFYADLHAHAEDVVEAARA